MNYSRRARRPDSLFYRDQRRLSLTGRSRHRARLYAFAALAVAIALALYLIFRPR